MAIEIKTKDRIKIKKFVQQSKIQMLIDIAGPLGNAYFLMSIARQLAMQIGKNPEISTKMTSGDYSNLLAVFRAEFGDYVHLVDSNGHYDL